MVTFALMHAIHGRVAHRYLEGGLEWHIDEGRSHGEHLRLRCRPHEEAKFYRGPSAEVYDTLPRVRANTLVVAGEHSTSLSTELFGTMAGQIPGARFKSIPGTHFLPMVSGQAVRHSANDSWG